MRYYNENKDSIQETPNDKNFKYMEKLNKHTHEVMQKNINKEKPIKNDYISNRNFKDNNKYLDIYGEIPIKKLYKEVILNELNNYELRQAINNSINEESDSENVEGRLQTLELKSFQINNKNNTREILNKNSKSNGAMNIRENLNVEINPSPHRIDRYNNYNKEGIIKKNSLFSNGTKISKNNEDINKIANNQNNYNNNMNKPENKLKALNKKKSIFTKIGETITNFDPINTKRTENSTLNSDFKIFRQSGFIINSDFIKKDETNYNGLQKKKYNELENFYDRATKKDVLKEELINYFSENQRRGFIYEENKYYYIKLIKIIIFLFIK